MQIRSRLARLQRATGESFSDVLRWITAGRFYDELNTKERERYAAYWHTTSKVLEELEIAVTSTIHKPLEQRPKPPTQEQHAEIIADIYKMINSN